MSNDVSLDINQKSNPVQAVAPPKEDNNMLRATDKITALYCRLSVEDTKEKDGKDDPSNSIQHQQIMLMEYAKSQHFPNPTFFIDDGYSGVDFSNRPGFQKMLAEIEAGHVEAVITKDLSRLGRNSSLTGLYINYTFPQYGVRYINLSFSQHRLEKREYQNTEAQPTEKSVGCASVCVSEENFQEHPQNLRLNSK